MRFVLYNIRYGTGGRRFLLPSSGYLRRTHENLDKIIHFLKGLDPDIIGLVEVDAGSYRSHKKNQAEIIAGALRCGHAYRSKYRESSLAQWLPLMNRQGNAFVTRHLAQRRKAHYLDRGLKRLVMELELEDLVIYLVHLSLTYRARQTQMHRLAALVKASAKPCIVAGDFNAFRGEPEIRSFMEAAGLANADRKGRPSYPSWAPKRCLDFILHSPQIHVTRFDMPAVVLSDHLPLVCDFQVTGGARGKPARPKPHGVRAHPPAHRPGSPASHGERAG